MTPLPDISPLTPLAQHLADEAGVIACRYFGTPLEIDSKSDETPVTRADREIELALRALLERERPEDGILGEEFGRKESRSGWTWVLDPIDGTKSFTIGRPTFGTLIGLCYEETPILGIIDQPVLNQRWMGVSARPTTFNDKPVRCRPCPSLKQAITGTGSPAQIGPDRHDRIAAASRYMVYQGDCYFYGLMANGFIDIIVEDQLGIYDFVALVPIIEGAGGKITDWQGRAKTLSGDPSLVACGDSSLHRSLLDLIAAKYS
jgi:inositol-phosphate phosphatase/L-galactose 1-phosphate phosphatase/histidinol-phosphatase